MTWLVIKETTVACFCWNYVRIPTIQDLLQNVQARRHFSAESKIKSIQKKYLPIFEAVTRSELPKSLKRDETGRINVASVSHMCL